MIILLSMSPELFLFCFLSIFAFTSVLVERTFFFFKNKDNDRILPHSNILLLQYSVRLAN